VVSHRIWDSQLVELGSCAAGVGRTGAVQGAVTRPALIGQSEARMQSSNQARADVVTHSLAPTP